MKTKWTYNNEDQTLNHTDGASLERWQIQSLLDGASEQSFRSSLKKEKWSIAEINSFVRWVNENGGFQYK